MSNEEYLIDLLLSCKNNDCIRLYKSVHIETSTPASCHNYLTHLYSECILRLLNQNLHVTIDIAEQIGRNFMIMGYTGRICKHPPSGTQIISTPTSVDFFGEMFYVYFSFAQPPMKTCSSTHTQAHSAF